MPYILRTSLEFNTYGLIVFAFSKTRRKTGSKSPGPWGFFMQTHGALSQQPRRQMHTVVASPSRSRFLETASYNKMTKHHSWLPFWGLEGHLSRISSGVRSKAPQSQNADGRFR